MSAFELTSPACLPLGIVIADGQPALLGITLQYPPIQLLAKDHNELSVTGARSPIARAEAEEWFIAAGLPPRAELEIELAIPAYMGLGSEVMMRQTVARGLSKLTGRDNVARADDFSNGKSLELWSSALGGLLVTSPNGAVLKQHDIHHDDENAWVFVIHMPHPPADTPPSLETDLRLALLKANPTTDVASLWAAVEANDAEAAGTALQAIQTETRAALEKAGTPQVIFDENARMLEMIRTSRNVLAWGQSFGGLATWGLIKGTGPSQEARARMRRVAGYEGGTILASITSNTGIQVKTV